ncbi:unnamed protein product [Effrenium voratum]|uniref:Uncharacterized protein n=1 Tax=Effrenium voratum TaxID=2562239 RepID=A0AA36NJZ8_9DINO|nr:unnamed protein product [Effrenium voratum]
MQQSLETLQKRLEEMKKMAQGPHDGRARGMVMRGPPPRTTTQKRHIQVDMGGFFEGSSAFPRCAHLAEQLAVARRKCVSEANALETAEAKEEAAAEDLSRLQARAAERQLEPEDEDKVQLLKHEESALVLGKARLEEECSEMRQRLQLLEHNTEQEEQQVKQHLRQVSSAQQRLLVAKQAALRTPAREEESPELQAEVQELISQEAFLKQAEEEAQRQLQDDEAASQVQAEEHRSQCRRLEEELAAAEASRPTERVSRLQAALAEQTHEAAECRAQGSALAARLASLRTHTAMQRRSLETQQEAEALRRHNAQRASEEAFSAEARKGQLQLLLSGAKSEAEALQECLQSTSLERTALREEVAAARREEQELRQEEQVRRTAQLRLSRELEAARAGCWEAEAKKTEVQKKEAQLQHRAARGAHGLATEEANFAAVQTAHRQLSSGVGSTLQELGAVRDECQSEETNLMALKVRLRQLLPAQSAKAEAEAAHQLRLGQLREELTQKQARRHTSAVRG